MEEDAYTGDTIPITPMTEEELYEAEIQAILAWYESGEE